MGNTIDNRVVEMRFDNKQFETAISATIQSLDKLSKALELQSAAKGFAGVTDAARRVDISSVSAGVRDINWALLSVVSVAQTVFRNITTSAMNAGAKIAKALTIQGATAGFREYEQKMGAIQTMMASTGESLQTVNKYLQELNEYSDQTIYSFSDMTQNIGKFTNAGVKLPVAVAAIKGIANAAALSGASAENAASAMYNLGQAMGKGYVADIDWRSIEFANMATVEFKDQIIQTAIAAGTLKETSDGLYKAIGKNGQGGQMKSAVSAAQLFADKLQYQWFTADILTKTLNKYADITTDIGRRATAAATNIKTFTQLISTVRESIQSGWAMSVEYVFGDLEEAKKLWTNVGLGIGSIIGPIENARNEMLKFWHENGGRDSLIRALTNTFNALKGVITPIAQAFRSLFPKKTGKDLLVLTRRFEDFSKKLMPSAKTVSTLREIFKNLFTVVYLVIGSFKNLLSALKPILVVIKRAFKEIFSSEDVINFSESLVTLTRKFFNFTEGLKPSVKFLSTMHKAFEGLFSLISLGIKTFKLAAGVIVSFVNSIISSITGVENFGTTLEEVIVKVADFFTNLNASADKNKFFENAYKTFQGYIDKFEEALTNLWEKVSEKFGKIGDVISDFASNVGVGISNAIMGLSTGLVRAIELLDENFENIFRTLMLIFTGTGVLEFSRFLKNISKTVEKGSGSISQFFGKLTGVLSTMQNKLRADTLKSIASSILMLAGAMLIMSLVPAEKLGPVMAALTGLLVEVVAIMASFDKIQGGMQGIVKASAALNLIAVALISMSVALKILATIDIDDLAKGIGAITGLLLVFAGFSQIVKGPGLIQAGAALLLISGALVVLAGAVKLLGMIDLNQLAQGIGAVAILLAVFAGFSQIIDPVRMLAAGISLTGIAIAITILAGAVKLFGTMPLEQLGIGLLGLAGALGLIVAAIALIPPTAIAQAAALVVVAIAIGMLAASIKLLGTMDWSSLAKSLVAFGGALLIISAFLYAMSNPLILVGAAALVIASGALLILSTVIKSLGSMSWESIVKSLVGLAIVFGIIAAAGYLLEGALPGLIGFGVAVAFVGAGVFLAAVGIAALAASISLLLVGLGTGARVIVSFLKELLLAVPEILLALVTSVTESVGMLVTLIITVVTAIIDALIPLIPKVFEVLDLLFSGLIPFIDKWIPIIAAEIGKLIVALLDTIAEYIPQIIEKATDIVVAFINGLAESRERIDKAATDLIIRLIRGIASNLYRITVAAMDTILKFIIGLAAAIKVYGPRITKAAGDLLNAFAFELGRFAGSMDFFEVGRQIVMGIIAGIKGTSSYKNLAPPLKTLVNRALGFVSRASGINSPAKVFMPIGAAWVEGIAVGVEKNTSVVADSAKSVVNSAYSAMASVGTQAVDIFGDIQDPVITPVVDMDNVYNSARSIASIMSSTPAMAVTSTVGARMSQPLTPTTTGTDASGNRTEVTFQQNNYSPKALSRLEIYRQTQNQLQQLKGLGVG